MSRRVASPASLTEQLAQHWSALTLEEVPDSVKAKVKLHILDTIACAVGGAGSDVVNAVVRSQSALHGEDSGPAALWGRAGRLAATSAALVNGTAAHVLELDDVGGCGHSGAVVVPAVLALGERQDASGAEVLMAVLAGYDVAARVLEGAGGYRLHNKRGWHSTGTCGSLGAAAGSARLLKLNESSFAHAMGIAGSFTGGIWAFLADGAMTKRFHAGKAAETGVQAAMLAAAGMSGPRFVLEADWGGFYSTLMPGSAMPEATIRDLGSAFRIERSGIKLYACCRTLHAFIDGVLDIMRGAGRDKGDIERIYVHGDRQTVLQFARRNVSNLLEAQFSAPYCAAVAIDSGAADLNQFTPLRTSEPAIQRLMAMTEVIADRDLGATGYPSAEICFAGGQRESRVIDHARGSPENPAPADEIRAKARTLLSAPLGPERTEAVIDMIDDLEHVASISSLIRHLSVR